jgi:hypothetical protein
VIVCDLETSKLKPDLGCCATEKKIQASVRELNGKHNGKTANIGLSAPRFALRTSRQLDSAKLIPGAENGQ